MTATNHTEHYDLSQFVNTDHPTFTGDYNGDMSKIDAAIYAASQSGGSGGLSTVSHDATLTGDGTSSTPLGIVNGLNFSSFNAELTWGRPLSEIKTPGLYRIVGNPQASPDSDLPDFIKGRTQVTAVCLSTKTRRPSSESSAWNMQVPRRAGNLRYAVSAKHTHHPRAQSGPT